MKAYQLLASPSNWCQGVYGGIFDGNFCGCVSGAIRAVYGLGPVDNSTLEVQRDFERLGQHLKLGIGYGSYEGAVVRWNDDPLRTWEEVHSALKECDL